MVRTLLVVIVALVCTDPAWALDQRVTYVAEHYREQQTESGFKNRIYHTLQVDSRSGTKLLILTGDDYEYRAWLREYLARSDQLLLVIPDGDEDLFTKARAYTLDVTLVHPIFGDRWKAPESGYSPMPPFTGKKHVLVADTDIRRRELVSMILIDLGYPVSVTGSGTQALTLFRAQPDKFRMIITDATLPGMSGADLVSRIMEDRPDIPVILGSGYHSGLEQVLAEAFSARDNVRVVPMVLRELPQTIRRLLDRNV